MIKITMTIALVFRNKNNSFLAIFLLLCSHYHLNAVKKMTYREKRQIELNRLLTNNESHPKKVRYGTRYDFSQSNLPAVYKCDHCAILYESYFGLRNHTTQLHSDKPFPSLLQVQQDVLAELEKNARTIATRSKRYAILETQSSEIPFIFKCKACGHRFSKLASCKRHYFLCHPSLTSSSLTSNPMSIAFILNPQN